MMVQKVIIRKEIYIVRIGLNEISLRKDCLIELKRLSSSTNIHKRILILEERMGLFNLLPNLSQILFHSFRIFVLDNFEKILQLRADIGYLSRSAWVE